MWKHSNLTDIHSAIDTPEIGIRQQHNRGIRYRLIAQIEFTYLLTDEFITLHASGLIAKTWHAIFQLGISIVRLWIL